MTEFLKAARIEQLQEGKLFSCRVDGELVCMIKLDGDIYAFPDHCTHIGGPLSRGTLEEGVLTCPWHMAQFDVRTGKVLRGPARQDLMSYPVKIEDHDVLVQLPDEAL